MLVLVLVHCTHQGPTYKTCRSKTHSNRILLIQCNFIQKYTALASQTFCKEKNIYIYLIYFILISVVCYHVLLWCRKVIVK